MTNNQIFVKAIKKAVKNGYVHSVFDKWTDKANARRLTLMAIDINPKAYNGYSVIFSHRFAKAFWGEKGLIKSVIEYDKQIPWIKVKDKELGIYYKDKNHNKFLKEKHSAHLIYKKPNGKYYTKRCYDTETTLEEICLGTLEEYPLASDYGYWSKGWQYNLQQMVLEKDPIKYLEKFL